MSGLHFHPIRVRDVRPEADDAMVITFDVPEALRASFGFSPGQYLTLRRADDDLRRSYSICAGPGEPLRVGVRKVAGGAFSSWVHAGGVKPGALIEAMEPQGRFGAALARTAAAARGPHYLFVAGGSGITPILSMLKAALERAGAADGSRRARCTLLYGNRSAASTMFKEEIEDLKNRHLTRLAVHTVFSREAVDAPLASGRIDADKIARVLALAGAPDEVFVCGPHAMNDEVEAALIAAGVAAERIHIERFGVPPSAGTAAPTAQPGDAATARIVVIRDGVTREVGFTPADGNVLAAAARAGLDVPYSCKSGVCATCRAKLVEGRVRMDRNFALDKTELEAGFVLTCQADPLTERVVVSFDER